MIRRLQYRRVFSLVLVIGAAFAGLGYRLVDLQVLRHDDLSARAQQNTQKELLFEPRRGDILDAKGNLLATSIIVKTIHADPVLIGEHKTEIARALAPLLEIKESELIQHLTLRVWQNEQGRTVTNLDVVLKRRIPSETWEKIQGAMSRVQLAADEKKLSKNQRAALDRIRRQSIFARNEQIRQYPSQTLAAHLLGYATPQERMVSGKPINEIVGRDGIELTFNSKLTGVEGWRVTETDSHRREVVPLREEDVRPGDGLNVVLSIDSVIQNIVESALAEGMEKHSPISISGIVVRPRTGEILALATLPNYDPNNPGAATTSADARRNRVICDVAEPGSTFKIVVVSGALNEQLITLHDSYDCEHGHFTYAGRILHDHEPYGLLSVENIITKSSNIGAAKIGIRMGENELYDYIKGFGFGAHTGIPLPGEVRGFVHPVKEWTKVSIAQIPMGQGVAVTRLQMIMAMCAIANNGWLMRPMLVDRLEDREHRVVAKYSPQRVRQVINEASAKLMVTALKTVVSPEGTAPKAALEHYTVAGKTGTAQKVEQGFYVRKYFSSFIGFFPADNPELCISVMMDDPKQGYYGGQTAAPVFKQIAERAATYLNIRPDRDEEAAAPGMSGATNENRILKTAVVGPQPQNASPLRAQR